MHHKDKQFIGDLNTTMATPLITTSEPLNKGCFPVSRLSSRSFTGFNIAPGRNIPYIEDAYKYEDIIFLTFKNYNKRSKGMICAMSSLKICPLLNTSLALSFCYRAFFFL
mmetsp:Transcript_8924/g.19000  ORF Transcript_8924/g.19000 Transcript_8924/m.19000 type:complete len:110 (-) Transcript_8924:290-619(-)